MLKTVGWDFYMAPDELMERLAAFEPTGFPFVSLYLNTRPDEHGRDHFEPFVRKQFEAIAKTFHPHTQERESFNRDVERINNYLANELSPSANGVVIFACAGAGDFFEAQQFEAPLERHRISVSNQPDLYPLARMLDQYDRYVALLADTNSARLFVFGLGKQLDEREIANPKTNRSQVGGWSQARFQRHNENIHLLHAKEVIDALDRVVREEEVDHIILSGDEVIIPLLRDQMPKHLRDMVVDVLRLDMRTPQHEVLQATLEAMRERGAKDDEERVERLLNEYRAGGLAVTGVPDTLAALEMGQVDELVISAARAEIEVDDKYNVEPMIATAASGGEPEVAPRAVAIADRLVRMAKQTSASVTFIEDPSLLAGVGGVGAFLRYKL
jgi:peptide chain release factor subunit 1